MSDPVVLTVTRDLPASPERAFDAWLDPALAGQFLFATPDGQMEQVEIDARVGGGFRIVERRGDMLAAHRGRYLEIERPRRLVFLFAADPAEDGEWTRVTVEIVPAPGGCTLTLTHEMDPKWAEYEAPTRRGWTMIVDGLTRTLETHDG